MIFIIIVACHDTYKYAISPCISEETVPDLVAFVTNHGFQAW